ncbi:MAG: bifunctional oligoribonuclease/PAP phosphatase NrnA [Thermodesulfobacteria bacterium]|nr:bifunctional oligoribonuclease/PAP phosphatase NrnA [Thermodesulfobacteriota bacterium]
MKVLEEMAALIRERERFFLVSHINPDGDAIGSMLGLAAALESLGKEVWPYLDEEIPRSYAWLPGVEKIRYSLPPDSRWTAIVLDCGDLSRIGGAAEFVDSLQEVLVLDHHEVSGDLGHLRLVEPIFATGALVFYLLRELSVPLTREIAENLYTAIFSDTGGFRFQQTTAEAFSMAKELAEAGADPAKIAEMLTEHYPLSRFCLLKLVLERLRLLAEGKVAISVLKSEDYERCQATKSDPEDFATFLRSIDGVEVTALVKEVKPGEISVSLRSRGRVNVARFAARFGGGGHRCAAGFRLKDDPGRFYHILRQELEALFA